MRSILFFVVLFIGINAYAQKVVSKTIENGAIQAINVDATNCFVINIETCKTNFIEVEAHIDGEYQNDLFLGLQENQNTLSVNAGFQPNFSNPNDKLSAHKVVSISLNIKLPEHKFLQVFGTNCNVNLAGIYNTIKITLADGQCTLDQVMSTGSIKTQSGNIVVNAKSGLFEASSKYGVVKQDEMNTARSNLQLSSITGAIEINKTE